MNVKPIALLTVVADNGMIGMKDDSPLPFFFDTALNWMYHIESGKDTKASSDGSPSTTPPPLRHSLVYGRRVYEEFAGYDVLPSGAGVNYVVSRSLANADGSPKPLPTKLGDESTTNPRLLAVGSVEQALELGSKLESDSPRDGELCLVLGGESIYTNALPKATFLRKFHMHANYEGGINFPKHSLEDYTPFYRSKSWKETNTVDNTEVELQVVEYVLTSKKDDKELLPIMESIRQVNAVFDQTEDETEE